MKKHADIIQALQTNLALFDQHDAKVMLAALTHAISASNNAKLEVKHATSEANRWQKEEVKLDSNIRQAIVLCKDVVSGELPDPEAYAHLGDVAYAEAMATDLASRPGKREQLWGEVLHDLVHRRATARKHYTEAIHREAPAIAAAEAAKSELTSVMHRATALERKLQPARSKRKPRRARTTKATLGDSSESKPEAARDSSSSTQEDSQGAVNERPPGVAA